MKMLLNWIFWGLEGEREPCPVSGVAWMEQRRGLYPTFIHSSPPVPGQRRATRSLGFPPTRLRASHRLPSAHTVHCFLVTAL